MFFPSLKKKINAKMFNIICIVFLGGVVVKLYEGGG